MEMFAINMKSVGALSCRALGYTGTTFDTQVNGLTEEQIKQYNAACEFWQHLFKVYRKFTESSELTRHMLLSGRPRRTRIKKVMRIS
jgi:thymidine phosphorylase